MNAQKCAGCPNTLKGVLYLQCCRCTDKFHHSCMNLSKKDFESFSEDSKKSWVCPSCRCKEPKQGDNTNTPIQGISSPAAVVSERVLDPASHYDNVTLRTKPRSSAGCGSLSADTIRGIIREELDRKFSADFKLIQNKLDSFEESLAFSDSKREELARVSETQKSLIANLQLENEQLRKSTRDLAQKLHQVEYLSRTNNIELQCVPENSNENLYNNIQQLGKIIKCPINDTDLQYCSRIAKLNTSSPRPRSILVKFSSRRLRDTFLAGAIRYNKNNPGDKLNTSHLGYGGTKKSAVFVSEHLTLETKVLHAAARQKAKLLNYRFVWVRDGKVYLRKTENSGYILVKDTDFLNNLSQ